MVDNSVINSIMGGLAWGDQSRRHDQYLKLSIQQQHQHALEDERRAKHQQYADQGHDLDVIQRMQMDGRPVRDGMVDSEFQVTPELASAMGPLAVAGTKIKAPRKANNPYSYKDSTGKTHQTEWLSPQELMERETNRAGQLEKARGDARTTSKIKEHKGLLDQFGIKTDEGTFLPDELDNVASYRRAKDAGTKSPNAAAQGWRAFTNYDTGEVTYSRMNAQTGQPEVRTADELKGIASPRARGTATSAKSAGGRAGSAKASTSGQITGMAEQVLLESKQGGGTSVEHAIANLENRQNYAGTPIGENRYQVIAALKKQIPKGRPQVTNRWRDNAALGAAPKPAQAAPATAPPSGKAVSVGQIQAYATKFGISVSEAKKKAEAEGYRVQ